MDNNIRYIRWAAGILKIIMVINIVLGVVGLLGSLLFSGTAVVGGVSQSAPITIGINIGAVISIVINAFITYTAARALELLADVAYHLLMTWHNGQGRPS